MVASQDLRGAAGEGWFPHTTHGAWADEPMSPAEFARQNSRGEAPALGRACFVLLDSNTAGRRVIASCKGFTVDDQSPFWPLKPSTNMHCDNPRVLSADA